MAADHFEVTVLYTTPEQTSAALKSAAAMAGDLGASIRVVVIRVVPFPLPLTEPSVPVSFTKRQIRKLARAIGVDVDIQVYDCRDRIETLLGLLPQHSLVVLSRGRRWFSFNYSRLA